MSETWFTSDTHFGHRNILVYESKHRPFATIEEMNEALVERWNSVVNPDDVVYHLGDFCLNKSSIAIASRLHGKKILILGNHDTFRAEDYLQYFDRLFGVIFWKRKIVLSHMPLLPDGERWSLNVHGHLHSERLPDTPENLRYFNVSVEQNHLTPFHADQLFARLEQLKTIANPSS
jgi:calcineurin-like phosphoesterase family protein